MMKFTPTDLGMCEMLDDKVNQRIKLIMGQFTRYQIPLGGLVMGHREAQSEQREVLSEFALILSMF